MAGLVVGGPLAVARREHDPARGAEQDLLERVGEVGGLDGVVVAARGEQRRLVGEIGEVGADHARGARGERLEVDAGGQRDRARVNLEDLAAAEPVGRLHGDAPVKSPRSQQRRVEDLGPVGRREHDHRLGGLEAVELGQDLIERLLALVVGAGERRPIPVASGRSRRARR